jgi:NAD(P)-dependent dehydrogenase (short-subunit alcohol dehydrogenase family)
MNLGLQGKVAIVTGRGIGFACAAELLNEGANVLILSQDAARNRAAKEALGKTAAGRVLGIGCDLRDPAAVDAAVAAACEKFGGIDILVNCGAAVADDDFFALSDNAFSHLFQKQAQWYGAADPPHCATDACKAVGTYH